jgi:hypothetical protein
MTFMPGITLAAARYPRPTLKQSFSAACLALRLITAKFPVRRLRVKRVMRTKLLLITTTSRGSWSGSSAPHDHVKQMSSKRGTPIRIGSPHGEIAGLRVVVVVLQPATCTVRLRSGQILHDGGYVLLCAICAIR